MTTKQNELENRLKDLEEAYSETKFMKDIIEYKDIKQTIKRNLKAKEYMKHMNSERNWAKNQLDPKRFQGFIESYTKTALDKTEKENELQNIEAEISRLKSYTEILEEVRVKYLDVNKQTLKQSFKLAEQKKESVEELTMKTFTYRGVAILVRKNNLVLEPVDAIVNPANTQLNHEGGAARAIADEAGDDFKQECIQYLKENTELQTGKALLTSAGGNLKCEYVIHTVGPIYKKNKADTSKECQQLCDAVRSVLEIVDKNDLTSVSIPAISTGIYGFPVQLCCQLMGKTIRRYIDDKPTSMKGKKIIICNFDDPTTEVFEDGLQNAVENNVRSDDDEEENQKPTKKKNKKNKKTYDEEESEEDYSVRKPKKKHKKTKRHADSDQDDEY